MILNEIHNALYKLDQKISRLDSKEIQKELENIPLDIFARIQVDRPSEYASIMHWLPELPSENDQRIWTGSSGHELMNQSLAFIKTIISTYNDLTNNTLNQSNILDFGCGWGRMIRLMSKYVPTDNIYAVDPWDKSLEICTETGVKANFGLSDWIPRSLPTPEGKKFDFIMAFSVFTHLSENVTKVCAATLRDYLTDDGILAITIRPVEFWQFRLDHKIEGVTKKQTRQYISDHKEHGFAFFAHNREKIEGEVTYGDTSMSLDYIKNNFTGLDIKRVEFNETDRYQLIVFLTKSNT